MIEITLSDKIDLTGIETKREARDILRNIKGLKDYEIVAISEFNENVIYFNCYNIKNNNAYYGLLDNIDLIIDFDFAGNIDDMI